MPNPNHRTTGPREDLRRGGCIQAPIETTVTLGILAFAQEAFKPRLKGQGQKLQAVCVLDKFLEVRSHAAWELPILQEEGGHAGHSKEASAQKKTRTSPPPRRVRSSTFCLNAFAARHLPHEQTDRGVAQWAVKLESSQAHARCACSS